ncbi:MAG TPA: hypothetical protein VGS10_24295 [Terracidiphilus sp.]|nr:hypothetical protein [Terracidiphilus sp.]
MSSSEGAYIFYPDQRCSAQPIGRKPAANASRAWTVQVPRRPQQLPRHCVHNLLFCGLNEARHERTEEWLALIEGRHGLPRITQPGAAVQAHPVRLVVDCDKPAEVSVTAGEKGIENGFSKRHELILCASPQAIHEDLPLFL